MPQGIAGLQKGVIAKALCNSYHSMSTLMIGLAPLTGASFMDQRNALEFGAFFDMPSQPPEHLQLWLAK
jgi:hypothetical protein